MDSEKFELVAQEEIKNSFPTAFVRAGVQIRSLRTTAEVDLFVLLPNGLFLIECKNYSGKINGSFNYDQKQGELWTCQTLTGEIVQITSSGKNPADQALARFHALHDLAKEAWGEANRPYIYPVLLFPGAADLSGITQMSVYPEIPSNADRVVATTLPQVIGYMANANSVVEQTGALKLLDFLGIPRASLTGTWLLEPPSQTQANRDNRQSNEQKRKQGENLKPGSIYSEAHGSTREKSEPAMPQFEDFSTREEQPYEKTREYIRTVPSRPPSRQIRWPLVVLTVAVVAFIGFMIGRMTPKPPIETASQNILSPQPLSPQEPKVEPLPPVETLPPPSTSGFVRDPPPVGETKSFAPAPQHAPPERKREAIVRETPIPRRPAEAGSYQTIKVTYARREPNELSEVVDELGPGRKLNVTGSQGDWLVVQSTTRQITVYIKRDDAMLISARESYQVAETRSKKVEAEITESLAKWGVTGVTASFRNDTVYLEGQANTDYERFRAEMAAKSIPEVQHIINRIRLTP